MDNAIRFRSAVATFESAEFAAFETMLFASFDKRRLLTRSLFSLMVHQIRHGELDDTHQINAICKSILDARRKNPKPIISSSTLTISKLVTNTSAMRTVPSAIKSHIASFLRLSETSRFMQCNRHIFISCCTPWSFRVAPSLRSYVGIYGVARRFTAHRQAAYREVFGLARRVSVCGSSSLLRKCFGTRAELWKWRSLDCICIRGWQPGHSPSDSEYLNLILRQTQIKQMVLHYAALRSEEGLVALLDVLSANPKIQCLNFEMLSCLENIDVSTMNAHALHLRRFTNLRGLAISRNLSAQNQPDVLCGAFVAALSSQLRSLHLTELLSSMPSLSNNTSCAWLTSTLQRR